MVEVEVRFKFPDLYCTSAFIYLVHANVGEFINNFRIFISLAEIRSRKLNFLPHRDSIPLLHKYFVLRKEKNCPFEWIAVLHFVKEILQFVNLLELAITVAA